MDDVKALALSKMNLLYVEPEYRIAYKILTSMLVLHNYNSAREKQENDAIAKEAEDDGKTKEKISSKKLVKLDDLNLKNMSI